MFRHHTSAGTVTVTRSGCTLSGQDFTQPLAPLDALYLMSRYGNRPTPTLNALHAVLHTRHATARRALSGLGGAAPARAGGARRP